MTQENIKPMNKHHDTNQTYDSCKDCEELAKEVLRVVKQRDKLEAEICRLEMIWETERGDNNRLKKENERLKELIKVANINGLPIDSENISKSASESIPPPDFKKELMSLLNKHSKEQDSNTPDFIIAEYLVNCLKTFNESVISRTLWYIKPRE